MAGTNQETHRFRVHARHLDHHARVLEETCFEAAAVAFVEDFGEIGLDGQEISVIVRNLDDGHEHCFIIDLDSGETAPCR
jgi:hypothetical protein